MSKREEIRARWDRPCLDDVREGGPWCWPNDGDACEACREREEEAPEDIAWLDDELTEAQDEIECLREEIEKMEEDA